jgi:CBS domain-containing protein
VCSRSERFARLRRIADATHCDLGESVMLLNEICTPDIVYCDPDTSVLAAARIMRERHVGDLVVVDESEEGDHIPLGMVTDRDIVIEVLAQGRDAQSVTVSEIMRKPAVIARGNEDASQAVARMKVHGVRRIPVLGDNRRLAGIISLDDLLRQLAADANQLAEIVAQEQVREHRTRR